MQRQAARTPLAQQQSILVGPGRPSLPSLWPLPLIDRCSLWARQLALPALDDGPNGERYPRIGARLTLIRCGRVFCSHVRPLEEGCGGAAYGGHGRAPLSWLVQLQARMGEAWTDMALCGTCLSLSPAPDDRVVYLLESESQAASSWPRMCLDGGRRVWPYQARPRHVPAQDGPKSCFTGSQQ